MANKAKLHKSVSTKTKGLICLAVLLVITVGVSCLGMTGMKLDSEGVNILLPWIPVSAGNWPASMPLSRALGGGNYHEYSLTVAEGEDAAAAAEDVAKVIRERLHVIGEDDAAVTVTAGNAVRVETRPMDHEDLDSILNTAVASAQFTATLSDGTQLIDGHDVKNATVGYNSTGTAIELTVNLTKDGQEKLSAGLEGQDAPLLTLTLDGDAITATASANAKANQIVASMSTSYVNVASNAAFFLNTGSIDYALTLADEGEIESSASGNLNIVLIVIGVLLAAGLVYMVAAGKLTGVAGIWAAWCGWVITLFFFTTIILKPFTVSVAVGLLLGLAFILWAACVRTKKVSAQIAQGAAPRQAVKAACSESAKVVWIAHAAVAVIGMILMIFRATEPMGDCLAAAAVASACAVALMRLFLFVFGMISKKPAMYGKAK